MTIVPIYRISDYSNPEKIKPDYASKENCLRNFIREFEADNLFVLCDNVSKETHDMVLKYVHKDRVFLSNHGNTGTFLASLGIAKRLLEDVEEERIDEIIFYFVEDDYIHRRGAAHILREAFLDLKADYATLYDHPDKYQNNKDERYEWGHGKVDLDSPSGVRYPKHIYGKGEDTKVLISTSAHWKRTGSTTMTWATTARNLLEDFGDMLELHTGKPLPMGGTTFKMLAKKNKYLISPIPSFSTHAEERWLSYFVNWEEEANYNL